MTKAGNSQIMRTITLLITIFSLSLPAYAKYSGGTGEPNDPYQIATVEDLILLGETPDDYDKHFILTSDIDLNPNLPGRKVFDRAVVAPDTDPNDKWSQFQGIQFTGVLDGNDHTISHLTIVGDSYLGLLGRLESEAEVKNLGVVDVNIAGSNRSIAGLLGYNIGTVTKCYSTGMVKGGVAVGGLVGHNINGIIDESYSTDIIISGGGHIGGLVGKNNGSITTSYSTGTVNGGWGIGGLVGRNYYGRIMASYSTCEVSGEVYVGGLVGGNYSGNITTSYSTGTVTGNENVGGLVGYNEQFDYQGGDVIHCYSTGTVNGDGESVGGLVGSGDNTALNSFWDIETSGQTRSAGGIGLTTAEMQTAKTFLIWRTCGNEGTWTIDEGRDYPRLWWQNMPGEPIVVGATLSDFLAGDGTENSPYLIETPDELDLIGGVPCDWDKHFKMIADIDMSGYSYKQALIGFADEASFTGVFDGNGYTISNLTITGGGYLGLFRQLGSEAEIYNLGLEAVDVNGTGYYVGSLAGYNYGRITTCYSTGTVTGDSDVGGLVGGNRGDVTSSYSTVTVSGGWGVGGLLGCNSGTVTKCYNTGTVSGKRSTGGLVGGNYDNGTITRCYNISTVRTDGSGGGLVSSNVGSYDNPVGQKWGQTNAVISDCYSVVMEDSRVSGLLVGLNGSESFLPGPGFIKNCYASCNSFVMLEASGLVGTNEWGEVLNCFWDAQVSGVEDNNRGGTPKTTAEMQTAGTFLEAGWDFVDETENGTDDIWKIVEGIGYPCLSWQKYSGGTGEPDDPYQIATAGDLILLGDSSKDYDKHFILTADIDLDPNLPGRKVFDKAVIAPDMENYYTGFQGTPFTGVFDGDSHTISLLTIKGGSYLGLFGQLGFRAKVLNLNLEEVEIYDDGSGLLSNLVGGLVGLNYGDINRCSSTSIVQVNGGSVGGLVGYNEYGSVSKCYSISVVSGFRFVGGLVGENNDSGDPRDPLSNLIRECFSMGAVSGTSFVGGLVGINWGSVTYSYSTASVSGISNLGGLLGINDAYMESADFGVPGPGRISGCYSTGLVEGDTNVGGLVGKDESNSIGGSFWDIQTSGIATSDGGMGKTTAEMQTATTFLEAGWDFIDETENGTDNIWWIDEGQDYPRLWWEAHD